MINLNINPVLSNSLGFIQKVYSISLIVLEIQKSFKAIFFFQPYHPTGHYSCEAFVFSRKAIEGGEQGVELIRFYLFMILRKLIITFKNVSQCFSVVPGLTPTRLRVSKCTTD